MSANPPTSSIIIRLQNLPNEARPVDIRHFFAGLNIPDGGVHVVGGEKGDAFINFSSDEDARQAMMKAGSICGNPIRLFLSSRSEMQLVIAEARAKTSVVGESSTSNKLQTTNSLTALLADFQARTGQPSNGPSFVSNSNGSTLQQLIAAITDKTPSTNNVAQPTFPYSVPMLNNPAGTFNDSITPQYYNSLNHQRAVAAAAALLLQQQTNPSMFHQNSSASSHPFDFNSHLMASGSTLFNPEDRYVHVRKIPTYFSYYNIKILFAKYKLKLSDIKIINDLNGQRTGEAVLRLSSSQELAELIAQDGRFPCFNLSILDIKRIDEYTFASTMDSFVPGNAKKTLGPNVKNCVRVTGFPRNYERKDVKRFFTGCNVTNRPGGIFIEADTLNGPTFVEFETEIDTEKALFYNNEQIESSIIEMYRITKQDMENEINALKRSPSDRQNRRPPLLHDPLTRPNRNGLSLGLNNNHHSDSIGTICLRLRNIPYSTSEQQIYDFFANDSMPIENCKILRDRFNRGAGEALVRFSDPQTCQMAYERKNRQIFHGRSLDLRLISTIEYQNCPLTLSNVSGNETSFHQGNNKRTAHFHDRNDNDRSRDKRARWDGNGNFHRNSNRSSKDQNDGKVSEETKNSSANSATNNFPPLPSEMNEHAGRILVLSNVAYRATREEILEFLRSYSPIPDTLKIRCDANGRPTGFGVVACGTADDAARAVEELHNQMFMARQISLQHRQEEHEEDTWKHATFDLN